MDIPLSHKRKRGCPAATKSALHQQPSDLRVYGEKGIEEFESESESDGEEIEDNPNQRPNFK